MFHFLIYSLYSDEQQPTVPPPMGLLARIASVFTPAKKQRVNEDTDLITATPSSHRPLPGSPLPHQVIVSKGALPHSVKNKADVYYTPHTGLVYTSPNTIEMNDLTSLSATTHQRRLLRRRKKGMKPDQVVLSLKLQFDSPQLGDGVRSRDQALSQDEKENAFDGATKMSEEEQDCVKPASPTCFMSPI